jgi:hypothetical protein
MRKKNNSIALLRRMNLMAHVAEKARTYASTEHPTMESTRGSYVRMTRLSTKVYRITIRCYVRTSYYCTIDSGSTRHTRNQIDPRHHKLVVIISTKQRGSA